MEKTDLEGCDSTPSSVSVSVQPTTSSVAWTYYRLGKNPCTPNCITHIDFHYKKKTWTADRFNYDSFCYEFWIPGGFILKTIKLSSSQEKWLKIFDVITEQKPASGGNECTYTVGHIIRK